MDVYKQCPVLESDTYKLRLILSEDAQDLLKVYANEKSVPFFNGDNCNGDNFYYPTIERMKEAVNFWLYAYENGGFVRWSIIDKKINQVIGTIELFHREAEDYFNDCGLLRLDLREDYENKESIKEILSTIIESAYDLFNCRMIATKAPEYAKERRMALTELGFSLTQQKLVGHDGTEYGSYWERNKK